ncbi:MAG: site-2 protease family protein [Bacilli bacterium]|nr:site-2 protease family protein [Bacilli bacterium]
MLDIIITVVVLIVMLGILISTHELGHLLVAKAFNVYCLEYSIGFGPKIFSRKKPGQETRFSVGVIPLGGYVSMYDEGVELPEGETVPPERCLKNLKPWKKSLVMVAGVAVNLFTAVLFTFIYALCFPSYYSAEVIYTGYSETGANMSSVVDPEMKEHLAYDLWIEGSVGDHKIDADLDRLYVPEIAKDSNYNEVGYVIDSAAKINGNTVIALYLDDSIKGNELISHLTFYKPSESFYPTAFDKSCGIFNSADITAGAINPVAGDVLELHVSIITAFSKDARPTQEQFDNRTPYTITSNALQDGETAKFGKSSLVVKSKEHWAPIKTRLKNGCMYFAYYFQMIGLGLKYIFTFNFKEVGSIVAMGSVLSQSSAAIGWGRTFFMYGAYLGVNLAILNLLPFPGLDGWQLLVTGIEKITRKQIPEKVKNIVSFVGVALLMLLGIAIIFRDVIRLFI